MQCMMGNETLLRAVTGAATVQYMSVSACVCVCLDTLLSTKRKHIFTACSDI